MYRRKLDRSLQAIQDCHSAVRDKGAPRITTGNRIGTRVDREAPGIGNVNKLTHVQDILWQHAYITGQCGRTVRLNNQRE
ncbi:hypothetical protein CONPUDRAFT_67840 [Coniophora puteana RWD-64-598 SS2]|uniref:Uncharacterized protein n=1 Tax=Coniophora puteana (strain RWD-64-598) TaxID=741705 RepID=R7SD66_CONPW|nr:uncharacterized protein CONPUDRAFT_67840 [Coniophora puteana RWD-64-598 SS2]EIW74108.1 hypothetical protein CONPUDRAFT_67840 [Coniophora puteana RWD-64-598 SS2]